MFSLIEGSMTRKFRRRIIRARVRQICDLLLGTNSKLKCELRIWITHKFSNDSLANMEILIKIS